MYKALDFNNTWVYGNAVSPGRDARGTTILVQSNKIKIKVKTRSVCEYTGVKDFKGDKIYTNDVLSYDDAMYIDRLLGPVYAEGDSYYINRIHLNKNFVTTRMAIIMYNKKETTSRKGTKHGRKTSDSIT